MSKEYTQEEKDIIECMYDEWVETGIPLYGNLSYEMVIEFLKSLDIDASALEARLKYFEDSCRHLP